MMTADEVAPFFTRANGDYVFARWERPIVPVVFGVDDATLATLKGAIETMVRLAGHRMAETDAEQGANLIVFFLRDWDELLTVPDLDRLVEGLGPLVAQLAAEGANQYRHFRLEENGAIRACIAFLKVEGDLAELPAETVALGLAAQMILLWSDTAFRNASPLALADGTAILRPDVANLIRAAYDPVLPVAAHDPSHALRLAARLGRALF